MKIVLFIGLGIAIGYFGWGALMSYNCKVQPVFTCGGK